MLAQCALTLAGNSEFIFSCLNMSFLSEAGLPCKVKLVLKDRSWQRTKLLAKINVLAQNPSCLAIWSKCSCLDLAILLFGSTIGFLQEIVVV